MSKVDVVVLAGAPPDADMAAGSDIKSRAMIPVAGKTMLQWVVDALRGASCIGRVVAVGCVSADGLDQVIEPGDNLVENICRGIAALDSRGRVLIVSSDVPLLTPESVDDFVDKAGKLDAALAYPVLRKEDCEKLYPGMKRTYVKTADGTLTGGNIMLVDPVFISENYDSIANAYAARKHIFQLARMIGMGVLFRVIVAQFIPAVVGVSALEKAASGMIGANLKAVISSYPEIGEDVDKLSDVEAVQAILAERS